MESNKTNYWVIGIAAYIILFLVVAIISFVKPNPLPTKALAVNNFRSLAPTVSVNGEEIYYYDLGAANLYKFLLKNGGRIPLSDNMSETPLDLIWSPDKTQVIIKVLYDKKKFEENNSVLANSDFVDQATMLWHYNLATKKYTMLNKYIFNPAPEAPLNPIWTADSSKIIYYLYLNPSETTLNIANPNGTESQSLGKVPNDIYSIISLEDKIIYYATYSIDTNLYDIYKYNLENQSKDLLIKDSSAIINLEESRIIADNGKESFVYDLTSKKKKSLPILIPDKKTTLSQDKNTLVTALYEKNIEKFYVLDLDKRKIIKILDPGLNNSNYLNLNLDSNDILYFLSGDKLFKIQT